MDSFDTVSRVVSFNAWTVSTQYQEQGRNLGGGGQGAFAPAPNLKNSDVFAHTILLFSYVAPPSPPRNTVNILHSPGKN